jgi:hypothetical protein
VAPRRVDFYAWVKNTRRVVFVFEGGAGKVVCIGKNRFLHHGEQADAEGGYQDSYRSKYRFHSMQIYYCAWPSQRPGRPKAILPFCSNRNLLFKKVQLFAFL